MVARGDPDRALLADAVQQGRRLRRRMLDGSGGLVARWGAADILYPRIAQVDGLSVELSGLLPNRDHNADLLAALSRVHGASVSDAGASGPVVALFLADPFLRLPDVAGALRRLGLRRVVNLPSVMQYQPAYALTLDGLGIGPQREFRTLAALADAGFQVSTAVAHAQHVTKALAMRPEQVFLAPRFDCWFDPAMQETEFAGLCQAIRLAAGPARPPIRVLPPWPRPSDPARAGSTSAQDTARPSP